MPNYEYECSKCKTVFTINHRIKDNPIIKCIKCNSPSRRIITGGANFILKGQGFYINDYKKKEKENVCRDSTKECNNKKCCID